MTASVTSVHVLSEFHGANGTAALTLPVVSCESAESEPPPPIECPDTPRRVPSARLRTAVGDEFTAQFSAASSWVPRLVGWSRVLLVSIPTTTKPHEARRGPIQLMLDQRAVKPGETATTGYRPAVVGQ